TTARSGGSPASAGSPGSSPAKTGGSAGSCSPAGRVGYPSCPPPCSQGRQGPLQRVARAAGIALGQQQGELPPVARRLQLLQVSVHGQAALPPGPPAVVIAVAQPNQLGAGSQPGKPAGDIVSPHAH